MSDLQTNFTRLAIDPLYRLCDARTEKSCCVIEHIYKYKSPERLSDQTGFLWTSILKRLSITRLPVFAGAASFIGVFSCFFVFLILQIRCRSFFVAIFA